MMNLLSKYPQPIGLLTDLLIQLLSFMNDISFPTGLKKLCLSGPTKQMSALGWGQYCLQNVAIYKFYKLLTGAVDKTHYINYYKSEQLYHLWKLTEILHHVC